MKTYDVFYPHVLPDVPGCPPEMAVIALRNTIIEFCEKSFINQVTQDPITLRANITDYDLDAPSGYRVQKIMRAWFRGKELGPIAPDAISGPDIYSQNIPGYTATKGPPTAYTQKESGLLSFMPIPDQTYQGSVTIRVAVVPLRDSVKFDDFLYEEWCEAIACGAKARLMLTSGKPYTNKEGAGINQSRYLIALNDARQRAIRGNVRSDLSVKLRKP